MSYNLPIISYIRPEANGLSQFHLSAASRPPARKGELTPWREAGNWENKGNYPKNPVNPACPVKFVKRRARFIPWNCAAGASEGIQLGLISPGLILSNKK